jgi:hypothetical protein
MGIHWAGQDYKVKLTDEAIGDPQNETRAILGRVEQDFNTIIIDGTLPKTRIAEVLMHELAHVAVGLPEFLTMDVGANMYGILAENGMLKGNFVDSVVDGKATKDEVGRILLANEKRLGQQETAAMPFRQTSGASSSYTVGDNSWDGGFTRFTVDEWKDSCLLHVSEGEAKANYDLPVREPNGNINRNACHAAAAVFAGNIGVSAPPDKKRSAARQLLAIYRYDLMEEPPESLVRASRA